MAVFLLVFPTKSWAVGGLNLTTSPLPISLIADASSTVSAQLKVKNGGNESEVIKIGLMKFGAYGADGKPKILDREKGDEYFDWVTFSPESFSLAPNEWKTVTMTINIPANAAFGYYYAVTFSRKETVSESASKTTNIAGAVATLVLLEVRSANAVRKLELDDFFVDKKVYEFLPVNFMVKLKNSGNVHVLPSGNIFISQGSQKNLAILSFNETVGNILPDSFRNYLTKWTEGFPVHKEKIVDGKVVNFLDWDLTKITNLRIGKYRATLLLAYDDGNRDVPLQAYIDFWVIPWRIILFGGVMIILIGFGLNSVIKTVFGGFKKKKR